MIEQPHLKDQKEKVRKQVIRLSKSMKQVLDINGGGSGRQVVQRLASKMTASAIKSLPEKQAASYTREMLTCAMIAEIHLDEEWASAGTKFLEEHATLSYQESMMAMGAHLVLHSRKPWEDWHYFEKMAILANSREPDFTVTQDLSVPEMAWALTEMRLIDEETPVDDEVWLYIAGVAHMQGYACLPHPLDEASHYLLRLMKDQSLARRCMQGDFSGEDGRVQKEKLEVSDEYVQRRLSKLNDEVQGLIPII